MKPEIKKLLILNLPYLLFVWLFDKVGAAVRLSPGADASAKLLHLGDGFTAAFSSIAPSFHPADLALGIAGAVIVRLIIYTKGKNAKKYRRGTEYGSARWGGADDIKPYTDPVFENNIPLTQTERLTMNSRPKQPKYARNKNILVIGGSGSGKTRFFVKPSLMQCTSKDFPTSYIVTDPKGTLILETGKMLQRYKYRIKVLNTINFKKSMKYNSISNQKAMLEEFAARQGFTNIVHFTDDGISGTCFDRPGFLAMMKEVEAGNVEYLCIKDMSRMGRDYLKVGQIMEILRQRGVRLIAINDGVDSARGDDDFTPFRNIMNEYYARDTSRKIRSTFQSKGKSGKHLTGTVIYGYLWNEARDQWLVDPEAADVVKRIFAMTIEGYGPYQIASKLKEEKILIPSAYLAQHGEGVNKNKTFKDVYGWGSSTICNILEKREYLGHTINFKTRKHFKDKKSHYVPEDEWTIFENTHEAIIDQQTFDLVQKIRGNVRRYPDGWGEAAPLTGLLYCADCGGKMYVHRTNNGKRISQYTCSQYSKVPVGKLCTTQHRINEDVVLSLVSEMLKAIAEYAKHDRAEFVRVVQEAQSSQQTAEVKKQRIRLATAKQRVSELEVLLCKIYEDNILGKLSDSRYATLDAQYEKEQSELTAEISVLEKAVKSYEKHEKDADRFIALIDKYENFDKLTIAMLNEFIEKILVHERDRKGSIQTTQEVEIYFNFVGRFVPPAFGEVELTPEELEEIRKREERKDRLHQNYLKRKASGAQKRYEDKIKKRKKAEIEAKKAAIRAEDIAKGVFVPVSSLPQREPMKGVQTA